MKTPKEGYELLCRDKTTGVFSIDAVAMCLFEEYKNNIEGYELRCLVRNHRPTIYEELEQVKSEEDFGALIARFRVEGFGNGQ